MSYTSIEFESFRDSQEETLVDFNNFMEQFNNEMLHEVGEFQVLSEELMRQLDHDTPKFMV